MAAVMTPLPAFNTGDAMGFPVVMKAPFDYGEYIMTLEVNNDDELAIGDLANVDGDFKLNVTSAKGLTVFCVILDTIYNKSVLEGHGLTVNKTSQFKSGDKIDVLPLIPGTVLSLKVIASQALVPGSKVVSSTVGSVQLYDDTPASIIGMAISKLADGNTSTRVGVLIK